jgi:anaerobic magnesium-protoporphyrin IX monomethyl ester cyclase
MEVILVNPPKMPGHFSFRDMAGGLGTSPRATMLRSMFYDMNLEQRRGPPMDLLYSSSVLERELFDVDVLDAQALRLGAGRTLATLTRKKHDAAGIRISLPSLMSDVKLLNDVKRALPDSLVFGFGPVIKTTYERWMDAFKGDFLIFGEPEAVISKALKGDYRSCDGILLPDKRPCHATLSRAYCQDLDDLPYPAWHLFPLKSYAYKRQVSNFTFSVLSSRGCPDNCGTCPYPSHYGRKWRSRKPGSIVEEMIYLKRRFGAVNVRFRDPDLGMDKGRLRHICELLKDTRYTWRWSCKADMQDLDEDTVDLMASAGCVKIMTGVEPVDGQAPGVPSL